MPLGDYELKSPSERLFWIILAVAAFLLVVRTNDVPFFDPDEGREDRLKFGDFIVEVDGVKVENTIDVKRLITDKRPSGPRRALILASRDSQADPDREDQSCLLQIPATLADDARRSSRLWVKIPTCSEDLKKTMDNVSVDLKVPVEI